MANDGLLLTAFSPDYIVSFVAQHPVNEANKQLAGVGKPGDRRPPTPAVAEFLTLLRNKRDLFTGQEYADHCKMVWSAWWARLGYWEQLGMEARIRCNFYRSMVDALHVWAMLSRDPRFERCYIDSVEDATGVSDVTVVSAGRVIHLALLVDTNAAKSQASYKRRVRNPTKAVFHDVFLLMSRPKSPGNKRWYQPGDFTFLDEMVGF